MFTDFYDTLSTLVESWQFGEVIKNFYAALPPVFIAALSVCFVLTFLGWALNFIRGLL